MHDKIRELGSSTILRLGKNEMNDRFKFGENWAIFLSHVNEERIENAMQSLREALKIESLEGKRVLDIGSGSGLFSLAAHRLGAEVVSFDYDETSVECTRRLKSHYGGESESWTIVQGSVLDDSFMETMGKFDGVYSWGVLHHTGNMTDALRLASNCVVDYGWFYIAIYNDQGGASRRWLAVKKLYNKLPQFFQPVFVFLVAAFHEIQYAVKKLLNFKNPLPGRTEEQNQRGMTLWIDWVDWVGGLPFEVAKPEVIIMPLRRKGFVLDHLTTTMKGHGCNEFVFHYDPEKKIL